jgi:hypothetical protein
VGFFDKMARKASADNFRQVSIPAFAQKDSLIRILGVSVENLLKEFDLFCMELNGQRTSNTPMNPLARYSLMTGLKDDPAFGSRHWHREHVAWYSNTGREVLSAESSKKLVGGYDRLARYTEVAKTGAYSLLYDKKTIRRVPSEQAGWMKFGPKCVVSVAFAALNAKGISQYVMKLESLRIPVTNYYDYRFTELTVEIEDLSKADHGARESAGELGVVCGIKIESADDYGVHGIIDGGSYFLLPGYDFDDSVGLNINTNFLPYSAMDDLHARFMIGIQKLFLELYPLLFK